jgi:hypothetical protein
MRTCASAASDADHWCATEHIAADGAARPLPVRFLAVGTTVIAIDPVKGATLAVERRRALRTAFVPAARRQHLLVRTAITIDTDVALLAAGI